jgi:hypothetical protein
VDTVTTASLPQGTHRIGALRSSPMTADELQQRADSANAANAWREIRRSTGTSQCGLCRAWFPNAGVHCDQGMTTVYAGELTAGCHRSFGSTEAHLRHIVDGGCVRDLSTVGLTEGVDGVWHIAEPKARTRK